MTESFWFFTGCAAAEAATHARNPNLISRFTTYLVQAIAPEQAPAAGRFSVAGTPAP